MEVLRISKLFEVNSGDFRYNLGFSGKESQIYKSFMDLNKYLFNLREYNKDFLKLDCSNISIIEKASFEAYIFSHNLNVEFLNSIENFMGSIREKYGGLPIKLLDSKPL